MDARGPNMRQVKLSICRTVLSVVGAAFCTNAPAAPPVLSGAYLYSEVSACAPTNGNPPYPPAQTSAVVTFNSALSMVNYDGTIVHFAGPNSYINEPVSRTAVFSVRSKTVKLGSETHNVVFSVKNGVVSDLGGVA